jgi:hypothetical protein
MKKIILPLFLLGSFYWSYAQDTTKPASASGGSEDIAQKLANPVGDVISVPFQNNLFFGMGPSKGSKWVMNVQPVIPVQITKDLNLISRVIVPVISQNDVFGPSGSQTGIGDVAYSAFVSPSHPKPGGWIWGVGPIVNIPVATDERLGLRKFGGGPTAVLLKPGRLTYGLLAWNLWAGGNSIGFLQPFFTKTFPNGASVGTNLEMTRNWTNETLSGILSLNASKVFKVNKQIMSVGTGPIIGFGDDPYRPDWGWRFTISLVFPK